MKITLIGLGLTEGDITLRAKAALDNADKILARTCECAGFASLNGYAVQTLDDVYKSSRNFDTLNKKLAAAVIAASKQTPRLLLRGRLRMRGRILQNNLKKA